MPAFLPGPVPIGTRLPALAARTDPPEPAASEKVAAEDVRMLTQPERDNGDVVRDEHKFAAPAGHLPISSRYRLDLMPDGNVAVEIGDCEAILLLSPKQARRLATHVHVTLCGDDPLAADTEIRSVLETLRHRRTKRNSLMPLDKKGGTA